MDFEVEPCPEESPKRSLDFGQGFPSMEHEEVETPESATESSNVDLYGLGFGLCRQHAGRLGA